MNFTLNESGEEEFCPATFRQKARQVETERHHSHSIVFQNSLFLIIASPTGRRSRAWRWLR